MPCSCETCDCENCACGDDCQCASGSACAALAEVLTAPSLCD
jgi:hypothetical protein